MGLGQNLITGLFGGGDGESIASRYGAWLGGLEQSNASMKSIADRLANFDVDGYGKQATNTLARANSQQEQMLAGQLGAAGWGTTRGGVGLSALTALRGANQQTYANSLLQSAQMGMGAQQAAAGIHAQTGQTNLALLQGLLGAGTSIYGSALGGMGGLNGQYAQNAQANATGRGQLFGGLLQGGLGLLGGALGGPLGAGLGTAIGGAFAPRR